MSDQSKIEWTDATWNPIRGCSRVSEGCRNCYAERIAARFAGPGQPYEGLALWHDLKSDLGLQSHWTGEVCFIPELLEQPLRWRRPRRIFVNSMSDLFHEKVQNDWLDQIFRVMAKCPQHTFQILTKRASRMPNYFYSAERFWPLRNVWLGVSVENQETADARIPLLLQTPAAVRWVSYEPALGPVDFSRYISGEGPHTNCVGRGLEWIVAGGESGPGARPCHPDWIRQARDQCMEAHVPFFFKQWGEWLSLSQLPAVLTEREMEVLTFRGGKLPGSKQIEFLRVGKKRAGALLDGIPWREYPAVRA